MHFFYGREGKKYLRFKHVAARDAWVKQAASREAVKGDSIRMSLKIRGADIKTGETLEDGPKLDERKG